ncbi:MAG: TlyA family RNA methyltransferase [Verrucomicrobiales bacterium]|nr:TlyA family RNA methyltransferase [Verrucomicrobiales bacterium]
MSKVSSSSAKQRLDQLLMERGLCDSREQGKRLIMSGNVLVEGVESPKPGQKVAGDVVVRIKERPKYVGRGGLKMEGALKDFELDAAGKVALDIGASTGGFTDCLLQLGATRVYTLDVGTNQLAWKIRSDPRVVARENFNARHLQPSDLPEKVDLIVIDVSFISLTLILGPAFSVLREGGDLICLIKPQFELAREDVGKGGIIRDEALRQVAVEKIRRFVTKDLAKDWHKVVPSAISGTDGNQEFLAWLRHKSE